MDLDALHSNEPKKRKKKRNQGEKRVSKQEKVFITGRPTREDEDFVKSHYHTMTDDEMGESIGRSGRSIETIRTRLGFIKERGPLENKVAPGKARRSYVASLDDEDKRTFFLKELKKSSTYKALVKALVNDEERDTHISFYEQKYIDFMTDPSVETMTSPERDMWHELTLAQIREFQYLRREGETQTIYRSGQEIEIDRDYSKEIAQCQEIIRKCHESLNVTRVQRLKNANDSAINFTEVIKELRSPEIRRQAGDQAAMFKYIAERHYNDHVGTNIISGNDHRYDVDQNFKSGEEPKELDGDFTGEKVLKEEEQKRRQREEEKQEESSLVATTSEEEASSSDHSG